MEEAILVYGPGLFWYILVGGLLLVALWESLRPLRPPIASTPQRWLASIGLTAMNMGLVRLVMPVLAAEAAFSAQQHGFGLFNLTALPGPLEILVAVMALDLLHYGQHFAMHRIRWLWRMHMTHHADVDFDCSTQLRFHPFEALLTTAVLGLGAVLLGASPAAVLLYYLLFIANGYFSHGNVILPPSIERVLRRVLVTPDMHRIHHSTAMDESNRNLSTLLSWWDRLFGTYRAEPAGGHRGMDLGLVEYRDGRELGFLRLLRMPFEPPRRTPAPPSSEAGSNRVSSG